MRNHYNKYKKEIFAVLLLVVSIGTFFVSRNYSVIEASTITVCSDGCTYATLAEAETNAGVGDTISITENITPGNQTVDVASLTISCSEGVTLGDAKLTLGATGITVDNCTFDHVTCAVGTDSSAFDVNASGATISNNTILNYDLPLDLLPGSDITFTIDTNTITNPCGQRSVYAKGTGTISDNTFTNVYSSSGRTGQHGAVVTVMPTASVSGTLTVSGNTITSSSTTTDAYSDAISIVGLTNNLTVAVTGNTIKSTGTNTKIRNGIVAMGGNVTIQENVLDYITNALTLSTSQASLTITALNILHNTVYYNAIVGDRGTTVLSLGTGSTAFDITTANVKYNIFQGYQNGVKTLSDIDGNITTYNGDYNAFYDILTDISDGGTVDVSQGANTLTTTNPYFVNASTDNFALKPFSYLIGYADDSSDLGAVDYSGSRRTTIYVDDIGSIDYVSIDFNDLSDAVAVALDGDTVQVAAGTYTDTVSLTVNANIVGASSATTTLDATDESYGISLSDVDSITISGFTISNANLANLYIDNDSDSNTFSDLILSDSTSTIYTMAMHPFVKGGEDYETLTGSDDPGIVLTDGEELVDIETATDISDYVSGTPQNWHLGLFSADGDYYTTYNDASVLTDRATANEYWGGMGVTIAAEDWYEDVFVYENGAYTYNDPGLEATASSEGDSGITLSAGGAGIIVNDSDSNTFTTLTYSGSTSGIKFTGTSASNNVNDGTFSTNTTDLSATGSANNNIKNPSYSTSSVTSTGNLVVTFKTRAYLTDSASVALENAVLTLLNSSAETVGTLTSGADGYSSYSGYLPAFNITSSGNSDTGNDHTYTAVSSDASLSASGTVTLDSQNELISVIFSAGTRRSVTTDQSSADGTKVADDLTADEQSRITEESKINETETVEIEKEQERQVTFVEQVKTSMGVSSRIKFNLAKSDHSLEVKNIDALNKTATVVLQSEPIELVMAEGDVRNVDLDGDGIDDVEVTLEKVEDGNVNLKIAKTQQVQDKELVTKQEEAEEIKVEIQAPKVEVVKNHLPFKTSPRNLSKEISGITNFISEFKKTPTTSVEWKIVDFLAYNMVTDLVDLTDKEKINLVKDYKEIYGRLPESESDWQDVIKIYNGETPKRVLSAEKQALDAFVKIFNREVDFSDNESESFIHRSAYRLGGIVQDIEKEKTALDKFVSVYKMVPSTNFAWSVIKAIAYSGVK